MDGRNEANAFNDGLADLLSLLPPPQFVVPGFTLFDQNAHASWIGLLCSGIVKLSVLDSRGIEHNLGLRGRGYWINAEEALISCKSLTRITTLTEASVVKVPPAEFKAWIDKLDPLPRNILRAQLKEGMQLQSSIIRALSLSH